MDDTLLCLSGFGPIEQPEVSDDEIDELARRIERKIAETEDRIEQIPDYPPRPNRVGGTIDVDSLIDARP